MLHLLPVRKPRAFQLGVCGFVAVEFPEQFLIELGDHLSPGRAGRLREQLRNGLSDNRPFEDRNDEFSPAPSDLRASAETGRGNDAETERFFPFAIRRADEQSKKNLAVARIIGQLRRLEIGTIDAAYLGADHFAKTFW
jgi:hypothetical protein